MFMHPQHPNYTEDCAESTTGYCHMNQRKREKTSAHATVTLPTNATWIYLLGFTAWTLCYDITLDVLCLKGFTPSATGVAKKNPVPSATHTYTEHKNILG